MICSEHLNYDNPNAYDGMYANNPQAERENDAFYLAACDLLDFSRPILDLGCGTGLVADLLEHKMQSHYVGVDNSEDMIQHCRKKYSNPNYLFYHDSAEEFIDNMPDKLSSANCVSIYALDHMDPLIVKQIVKKLTGPCLFIIFNNPWKEGSASAWAGREGQFKEECEQRSKKVYLELFKHGFRITNFLQQPYYFIATRSVVGE